MACTEFYCNASTGSNMNGGSDENTSPSYSATNGGWNSGTGVFTPTSGDPSASVTVGQFASVFTDGATTPVFIGRVTAVNSTTVTVSTTVMSGTVPTTAASGISINVGGVWKGPNAADGFPFNLINRTAINSSNDAVRVNLKNNATYNITAQITRSSALTSGVMFQGYTSTPGDEGKCIIDGGTSGASYVLLDIESSRTMIADIIFQNNGATGSADGIDLDGSGILALRCIVRNVRGEGFNCAACNCISCEATGCNQSNASSGAGFKGGSMQLFNCISHNNTGSNTSGFIFSSGSAVGGQAFNCIAAFNGQYGYQVQNRASTRFIFNCDSYANVSDGMRVTAGTNGSTIFIINCNLIKNGTGGTGYGINRTDSIGDNIFYLDTNAYGAGTMANASGTTNGFKGLFDLNEVTYANNVTPWVDPDNGDFRISLTAAKNTGLLTITQDGSFAGTLAYPDIGAAQHLDSGSSSVKGMRILGG